MSHKVIRSILAIVFARLVINITRRFPYPFVSAIGASFSVSADSIQNIIALTNGAGLLSPILGTISEHYGRKVVMVGALLMMTVMSILGALFSDYGIFVVVMFAFGVGKIIYDPTFQAYLGDVIHYSRRARVMGIAELSWALSLVIAAPVAGFLLDVSSVQAIFLFLAVLLALSVLALWLLVESDERPDHHHERIRIINPLAAMRVVSAHPPAVFALIYTVCLTVSHEIFFINYGLWMEDTFDLVLTALGAVTIVIAVAEIIGEFIVITIADRIGTKLTSLCGMLLAAISFLIIPHLSFSLPVAMFGIFRHVHQHRGSYRLRTSAFQRDPAQISWHHDERKHGCALPGQGDWRGSRRSHLQVQRGQFFVNRAGGQRFGFARLLCDVAMRTCGRQKDLVTGFVSLVLRICRKSCMQASP